MNIFTFTGNLGRDVEVRHTSRGMAIASFSVAVKSGYGDKQATTWVRCSLFGKRAEGGLIQYLVKGQLVGCSGEAKVNTYMDKGGVEKSSLEVAVDKISLLGSISEPSRANASRSDYSGYSDDIPF